MAKAGEEVELDNGRIPLGIFSNLVRALDAVDEEDERAWLNEHLIDECDRAADHHIIQLHSDNDPFIPLAEAQHVRRTVASNAKRVCVRLHRA